MGEPPCKVPHKRTTNQALLERVSSTLLPESPAFTVFQHCLIRELPRLQLRCPAIYQLLQSILGGYRQTGKAFYQTSRTHPGRFVPYRSLWSPLRQMGGVSGRKKAARGGRGRKQGHPRFTLPEYSLHQVPLQTQPV